MSDTVPQADAAPLIRSFTLDFDIAPGGSVAFPKGTEIKVRKPGSGELRGLALTALLQLDYTSLETLAPRITQPVLHKQHVMAMDPADMMQFGSEVMDFLLPSAAKAEAYQPA
ncbi:phage tail assembly protein [Sphingomonas sp. QA11]|uniref:phage tail assembly protein n=1 Tax=Sphingomonas sp. QA11 TaxID=2950605 RepID=UPI00234A17DB|nr:phage tail assembly protein [Sphingomonas sp. QA11]WCM29204.1 phage tail assembly protein [Sphingomonas sp. QA11]